jgi:hypothetical protein
MDASPSAKQRRRPHEAGSLKPPRLARQPSGRAAAGGTFRTVSRFLIYDIGQFEKRTESCLTPATPIRAATISRVVTTSKGLTEPGSGHRWRQSLPPSGF